MFPSMPMMVIDSTWWVPFHSINYVKKAENGKLRISFRANDQEGLTLTVGEDQIAYALFPQPKEAPHSSILVPKPEAKIVSK